jgi:hypothetical protein
MVLCAFKVGYVFDVAQVESGDNAQELPAEREWITQNSNTPEGLWDRLASMTAAAGFSLELRPALPEDRGARGWTNYRTRIVWVGNEHGEAEALRVLAHEYAGHIRADHEHRTVSREQRETDADSIAYLVLKALGFDISSSTVDYLAGWLPDAEKRAEVIRAAAETVRSTAVAVLRDRGGRVMRYEVVGPTTDVECCEADDIEAGQRGLALVVGDPEATALVVIGNRAAILALLRRAVEAVQAYPLKWIAITDVDGNVSVRREMTGEYWTPETAAQQLRFAAADGAVLDVEVREGWPAPTASAAATYVHRVMPREGRPHFCWRSLRTRARSQRWAARTSGWRALALRQRR